MRDRLLYIEKKRRSSKTTKNIDNNDGDAGVNNNNNIDGKLKEESQSLQNGHCHVEIENEEENDVVSDLPLLGGLRKLSLSHSRTPPGDNINSFNNR